MSWPLLFTLSLPLVGATGPRFVEDRKEIPWIVVTSPGQRCGEHWRSEGPRGTGRASLLESLSPVTTVVAPKAAMSLPLLPTPGLFGLEGEIIVVTAEALLRRARLEGAASVHVDDGGARLDLTVALPASGLQPWFSNEEIRELVRVASARLARRHANVGSVAVEQALRFSCFRVAADPAVGADIGRQLRTRFSALL